MAYKFGHSVIGGTFDRLHKGHEYFITSAFENSEFVTIGLATSKLFQKKIFPSQIQSFSVRKRELEEFLRKKNFSKRTKIIKISDFYGNTLKERNIDALFVTKEGLQRARKINAERKKRGYSELEVVIIPLMQGLWGDIISSNKIRSGKIDRKGLAFIRYFNKGTDLKVPATLRQKLRLPFGKILEEKDLTIPHGSYVIAVGDVVTFALIGQGIVPNISIFDYITKKEKIDKEVFEYLPQPGVMVDNPAGSLKYEAVRVLHSAIRKSFNGKDIAILVKGEEDLLALPAILFAPLDSYVFYGLRDTGMVRVKVTEKAKNKIITRFLDYFTAS